jgi:uncharacterized membrane protein YkoI
MYTTARKSVAGVAALGALALGGSAIADAASTTTNSSGSSSQTAATQGTAQNAPQGQPPAGGPGGQHTRNGKTEKLLTGDTAAKVKAAALAKVSGGTIERVETDVDHGSPYEAHVRKADGTSVEVLVNENFEVTAVNSMR